MATTPSLPSPSFAQGGIAIVPKEDKFARLILAQKLEICAAALNFLKLPGGTIRTYQIIPHSQPQSYPSFSGRCIVEQSFDKRYYILLRFHFILPSLFPPDIIAKVNNLNNRQDAGAGRGHE